MREGTKLGNDPFRRPVLVHHRNRYWYWRGLADCDGRYHLLNPFYDDAGCLAEPSTCRMVRGDERILQLNAIDRELTDRRKVE